MSASAKPKSFRLGQYAVAVDPASGIIVGLQRMASEAGPSPQVVDAYDAGRGIQQSVYGDPNSTSFMWDRQPWTLNAVEGGHWNGGPAYPQGVVVRRTTEGVETHTLGTNWASGATEGVHFKKTIVAINGGKGLRLRLRVDFASFDGMPMPPAHQEMPAIFLDRSFARLSFSREAGTFTVDRSFAELGPDLKPDLRSIPEFENTGCSRLRMFRADGWGVEVTAPTFQWAGYRFLGLGAKSACSYLAPLLHSPWGAQLESTVDIVIRKSAATKNRMPS